MRISMTPNNRKEQPHHSDRESRHKRILQLVAPIALLLVAFVSLLLFQAGSMHRTQQQVFNTLESSAQEQARALRISLAGRFDLLESYVSTLDPARLGTTEAQLRSMGRMLMATDFSRLMIANYAGDVLTSQGARYHVENQTFYTEAMRGNHAIAAADGDAIDPAAHFVLAVPMRANGRVVGAVAGTYSERAFRDLLKTETLGGTMYAVICDRDGNVLIGSDKGTISRRNNLFSLLESAEFSHGDLRSCREDVLNGKMGIIGFRTSTGGNGQYAVYMPIGVNDWRIVNFVAGDTVERAVSETMTSGVRLTASIMTISLAFIAYIFIFNKKQRARLNEDRQRLRISDERFRLALSETSVSIWEYDYQTRRVITGEEDDGDTFAECRANVPDALVEGGYIHPDSVNAFLSLYERLFAGERHVEEVIRARTPEENVWRYMRIRYTSLLDENGNPYRAIGISEDVTENQMAKLAYERELQVQQAMESDTLITALFDATTGLTIRKWFADEREAVSLYDDRLATFTAYIADHVIGDADKPKDWTPTISLEVLQNRFNIGQTEMVFEYLRRMPDGSERWVEDESHLLIDPDSGHLMMFTRIRDVDEAHRQRDALLMAADSDSMTGLLNHGAAMERIEKALAERQEGLLHALFMVDIDDFKEVNDTLGHMAGDDVIRQVASLIRGTFRESDVAGRIGGDEFIVLMKNAGSVAAVRRKAQELTDALQFTYRFGERTMELSASVGVCVCKAGEHPLDALYHDADAALYESKEAGKNRFTMHAGEGRETGEPQNIGGVSSSVHLKTLLEQMDGGVVMAEVDEEIRIVYVSPSLYRLMGIDREATTAEERNIVLRVLPEDWPALERAVLDVKKKGVPRLERTYRVHCNDGIEWRHITGAPLPEQADGICRLIGVITDVTELKRSEERLQFAQLRYRTAVEQSSIMQWDTDLLAGTMVHSGEIAERIGLAGKRLSNLPDSLFALGAVREDSIAEYRKMYAELLSGDDSHTHIVVAVDTQGNSLPLSTHFRLLRDASGRPHYAVGVAEPLLFDSKELALYRTMAHGGVFSARLDGRMTLLYGNDKLYSILEYTKEALKARHGNAGAALTDEEGVATAQKAIADALDEGLDTVQWVARIVTALGREKYVQVSGRFEQMPDDGRILNGVVIDVTEEKRTEMTLAAEQVKTKIAMRNANLFVWEYDILHDVFTSDVSRAGEGFCGSLQGVLNSGRIHVDSLEAFQKLHETLLDGAVSASEDVHLTDYHGKDTWFRLTYQTVFDEAGRAVTAIGIGLDLSEMRAANDRIKRLRAEWRAVEHDSLGFFSLNLTKNTCDNGDSLRTDLGDLARDGTADGFFMRTYARIPDAQSQQSFREQFSRGGLLRLFAADQRTVTLEQPFLVAGENAEWLRWTAYLLKNPDTGDVESMIYARSIQAERTLQATLERLVSVEYEYIALIDTASSVMTLLSANAARPSLTPENGARYASLCHEITEKAIVENERGDARISFDFGVMLDSLNTLNVYTRIYAVLDKTGVSKRKKWQFTYLDDTRRTIVLTMSDVTDTFLAEVDPVTGIFNRFKLAEQIRGMLDRHPDVPFALVRIDIDNFKVFNDIYGVAAGDRLLLSAADYLRSLFFRYPLMLYGHIEADHFLCCLPANVLDKAPKPQDIVDFLSARNPEFAFSVRIGVYRIEDAAMDVSLMSDRAYLALKSVKGKYGKHVAYYSESMRSSLLNEQEIVGQMHAALDHGQFDVYLQPQYDYATGEVTGAEALARWLHPERGVLTPGEFIHVFERNGFITQLDQFIWERACALLAKWKAEGKPVVPLSVNVSRVDIYDHNALHVLEDLLQKYGVSPRLLRLEITETAYMENPDQLIGVVEKLRAIGFSVEMDDFGSGFSSLSMLNDVQVDSVKLDMRFLSGESGVRGNDTLNSIVRMMRWLRLPVLAEGVETVEQAEYLKSIGCVRMQGYYFGRPTPVDTFERIAAHARIAPAERFVQMDEAKEAAYRAAAARAQELFGKETRGALIVELNDGNVEALRINDRFYEASGLRNQVLTPWALHLQDSLPEESRQPFLSILEKAAETGAEATGEFPSVLPGGERVTLCCTAIVLMRWQGRSALFLRVWRV